MKRNEYLSRVNKDHSHQVVRKGFQLYAWIWYRFQFFVQPPELRRPFTFWMRDALYTHRMAFTASTIVFYGLVGWLTYWNRVGGLLLCWTGTMVLAHLIWGKDFKPGEQEQPTYIEDE